MLNMRYGIMNMTCKFQKQFLMLQQIFKFIMVKECKCEGRWQRLWNPFFFSLMKQEVMVKHHALGRVTWVTRSTITSSDRNMQTKYEQCTLYSTEVTGS